MSHRADKRDEHAVFSAERERRGRVDRSARAIPSLMSVSDAEANDTRKCGLGFPAAWNTFPGTTATCACVRACRW